MNAILLTVCILFQVTVISSGVKNAFPANILHEHPNRCFSLPVCRVFDVNAVWQLPGCGKATCQATRQGLVEIRETCPEIDLKPGCYIPALDMTLSFPLCCRKQVCPGDRNYRAEVCGGIYHHHHTTVSPRV